MKTATLKYICLKPNGFYFHICYSHLVQTKKKTTNIWQYKVGIDTIIAKVVLLLKPRL